MSAPLLEVRDLQTHFVTELGTVRAVDGASFKLEQGQTLGIVGESGLRKIDHVALDSAHRAAAGRNCRRRNHLSSRA